MKRCKDKIKEVATQDPHLFIRYYKAHPQQNLYRVAYQSAIQLNNDGHTLLAITYVEELGINEASLHSDILRKLGQAGLLHDAYDFIIRHYKEAEQNKLMGEVLSQVEWRNPPAIHMHKELVIRGLPFFKDRNAKEWAKEILLKSFQFLPNEI